MVTKAVPFIFQQTKTEKYPLTSLLVVLRSLKNKRHLKDCYIEENLCETHAHFPEAMMAEVTKVSQMYSSIFVHFGPSVNKYQYRSNLQDVLRNATVTVFLKHYISNLRYCLPTLFMTCDLWPSKERPAEILHCH